MPLAPLQSVSSDSLDGIEWVATTRTTDTSSIGDNDKANATNVPDVTPNKSVIDAPGTTTSPHDDVAVTRVVKPSSSTESSSESSSSSKSIDNNVNGTAANNVAASAPIEIPIVVASPKEEPVDDSIGIEMSYDSQRVVGSQPFKYDDIFDDLMEDVDLEEADKEHKLQLGAASLSPVGGQNEHGKQLGDDGLYKDYSLPSKNSSCEEGVEIQHFDRANDGPRKLTVYPNLRKWRFYRKKKRMVQTLLVFLVIGAVGFIISGLLEVRRRANQNKKLSSTSTAPEPTDPDGTKLPTLWPTASPTHSDEFWNLYHKLRPVLGKEIPPQNSLQFAAMDWMVNFDRIGMDFVTTPGWVVIERFIIVLLYFSTGAGTWTNQVHFLSPTSVCSWNDIDRELGILCDDENHVIEVSMFDNNLIGTIPSEISGLSKLMSLSLANNLLTGSLPESIGKLGMLTNLDVGGNLLTGTIPESYGNLINMWFMLIYGNPITGTIPPSIAKLPNLIVFGFWDNHLIGTLPEFNGQKSLYFISSAWNNMTGTLPSSLFKLPNLKQLYLLDAQFSGTIPTEFGHMTRLEVLTLRHNHFSGTIPTEIGLMTKLTNLELAANDLTGTVPEELENLTRLNALRIYDNEIYGEIPSGLANLSNLDVLRFERTDIIQDFSDFCLSTSATFIYADCGGHDPEVDCPCCLTCCEDGVECQGEE